MYERKCPNCGGDKIIFENGHFKCAFCDTVFADTTLQLFHKKISYRTF